MIRFLIVFSFLISSFALANEKIRPTDANQLPIGTVVDRAFKVKTATVVKFNRVALERDFPKLKGQSDEFIKNWILSRYAYINEQQLRLTGVRNTEVIVDRKDSIRLYVQPGVGRGGLINSEDGFLDLKASGNTTWNSERIKNVLATASKKTNGLQEARMIDHASGLEVHILAIAEYIRQIEIQRHFDLYNANSSENELNPYETVENYFLIDYGINVYEGNDVMRAFAIGRQANIGRSENNHSVIDNYTDQWGHFQGSYAGARVDFGGARTTNETTENYHDRIRDLDLSNVSDYIDETLAAASARKLQTTTLRDDSERDYRDLYKSFKLGHIEEIAESISKNLNKYSQEMHFPDEGVIGMRGRLEKEMITSGRYWAIETPYTAVLKWVLFQLKTPQLKELLPLISSQDLEALFMMSGADFQMPLPEAVYAYGLNQHDITSSAIYAAMAVFSRYPKLVEATTSAALAELNRLGYPTFAMNDLISSEYRFKGYEDFLFAFIQSGNLKAQKLALEQVKKIQSCPAQLKKRRTS